MHWSQYVKCNKFVIGDDRAQLLNIWIGVYTDIACFSGSTDYTMSVLYCAANRVMCRQNTQLTNEVPRQ